MSRQADVDVVTGAFSYSGAQIAGRLIDAGRNVRTLTHHPDRPHPLQASVETRAYRFDDPAALARSLEGVDTLYNTFVSREPPLGQIAFSQWLDAHSSGVGRDYANELQRHFAQATLAA